MSIALTQKQKQNYITYIDLLSSVINKTNPPKLSENVNWRFIFKKAEHNSVLNLIGYTLDKVNVKPSEDLYAEMANRRNFEILKETSQLHTTDLLLREFDRLNIDNLPLKGYFMKQYYPQSDFRTMGDVDILIDRKHFKKLDDIFTKLGFENAGVIKSSEMHFKKDFMYFEIHSDLNENDDNYYDDIWNRVKLRNDYKNSYEMTLEDFYIYLIYHAGKHFTRGGIGIRMVMDIYVFLKKYEDLNMSYIDDELKKMELYAFEKKLRSTAFNWFSDEKTVIDELGEFILYCSTFGKRKVAFYQSGKKTGGAYWIKQVFIPYKTMRSKYNYLNKAPALLPFSWVQLWFTRIFIKRDLNLKHGFSDRVSNLDEKDAKFMDNLMNDLELH